ncbi:MULTISPECIES: DUF2970 domain-containing protein [Pseudomonadaceae]|jgi:hypothetical protein|uniref:DUF2970 domain-containing protein n=1 Tax=Pseudomonadaceae TaxID=135621 RepID=UPI00077FF0F4|nr:MULTISPECIES: DUF2970 domain-containing protein [Pseudomonas]AMR66814.1 hypothetical protein A0T30_10750 [Pseudomonas alcaligenes]MDC7825211.1 DUF2970 domain-containing protein [Pseudomonas sp. BLCC-B13]MEE1949888.1 DUF2970 domain-containing protein [Pseudomonas alcaligenes]
MDRQNDDNDKPLSFREMLQSVVAAAFGVQSGKNRARDFSRGKPSHFIALGLMFTALFVVVLFALVQLVLYLAGV